MNTQELINKIKELEEPYRDEKNDRERGYLDACADICGILWSLEDETIAVDIDDDTLSSYFIGRNIDAFEMFKYMIKNAE